MEKELFIQTDNGKLSSTLDIKNNSLKTKTDLAILCHGFTGGRNKPLMRTIANELSKRNISSLRFDYMGYGNSYGTFQQMNIPDEIKDTISVYDYVRSLSFVKNIYVIGHSQGSIVALMAFCDLPKNTIKKMILLSPAKVLKDDCLKGNVFGSKFDASNPPESIELWDGRLLGRKYITTSQQLDILAAAKKYKGETHLVYAMEDKVMPYSDIEELHKCLENSSICVFEHASHGFKEQLEEVAIYCADTLIM